MEIPFVESQKSIAIKQAVRNKGKSKVNTRSSQKLEEEEKKSKTRVLVDAAKKAWNSTFGFV